MEEDFDLSLSPTNTKASTAPKQGRRANRNAFGEDALPATADDDGFNLSSPLKGHSAAATQDFFMDGGGASKGSAGPPLKGRRTGGWAEERAKTAAKTGRRMGIGGGDEDDYDGGGVGRDVPLIPDLDEVQDEDMAMQVADAPSVAVNRVATYRELDNDLLKQVAFATLDDIDLKLLTRSLAPEAALREPDEQWTWDTLFAEISGDLHKEWNPEEEEEEKTVAAKERPYTAFNRFPV